MWLFRPRGWRGAAHMSGSVAPVECSRGTLVAIGFSAIASAVVLFWLRRHGLHVSLSPFELASLLLVAALAGRISVVLAPRGAWAPSSVLAVAVGLVAGPLVGAWAGAATVFLAVGSVWRYRLTW